MGTRRMVILGLFIAIAGVLHAVESWLPIPMPVPGAKLGLANVVSLLVICLFGWKDAISVAILRVLIGTLLGGAFLGPAFAMSMSGAIVSVLAMAFAYHFGKSVFSLVGISVIGAVIHNLAQVSVAAVLVASPSLFWYLPYLLLFALPTGVATGLTAYFFLNRMSTIKV